MMKLWLALLVGLSQIQTDYVQSLDTTTMAGGASQFDKTAQTFYCFALQSRSQLQISNALSRRKPTKVYLALLFSKTSK